MKEARPTKHVHETGSLDELAHELVHGLFDVEVMREFAEEVGQ